MAPPMRPNNSRGGSVSRSRRVQGGCTFRCTGCLPTRLGWIRSKSGSVCCSANICSLITFPARMPSKPLSASISPITIKRPSRSTGPTPSRSSNRKSVRIYESMYLGKLQAVTMVCQYINPLAGAFYQKRRPRLLGMEESLLRLLINTLHLILVRCWILFHSTHLNPLHKSLADCPGEAFSFFLVHSTPLASCEPVLLMRVPLTVLKNLQDSALKHYIPWWVCLTNAAKRERKG